MPPKHPDQDRNFDDLTPRFRRNIYATLKGQLRLAVLRRDFEQFEVAPSGRPLRILDVGAGQGQFALELARQGHELTLTDISSSMLDEARQLFEPYGNTISPPTLICCAAQELQYLFPLPSFDVVLCHAVMEWLQEPQRLLEYLIPQVKAGGIISIIFYNQHGLIFKNLLRTNFKKIATGDMRGKRGSLTPLNPLAPDQVRQWFASAGLRMISESGIRVFHDYILDDQLRNQQGEALIEQELAFSQKNPYKDLGRYMHFLAKIP